MNKIDKVCFAKIMLYLSWEDSLKIYILNKRIYNLIKNNENHIWKLKLENDKIKDYEYINKKYKEHYIKVKKEEGNWILFHTSFISRKKSEKWCYLERGCYLEISVWNIKKGFSFEKNEKEDYNEYPSLFIPGILPPQGTKFYVYEINNYYDNIFIIYFDTNIDFIISIMEKKMEINTVLFSYKKDTRFYELKI